MSSPEFVVVYKASGELEAHIVKGRLTTAGIPAMFQNEALGTLGFTVDGLGEFRILVPCEREQDALEVLEGKDQESPEGDAMA